MGKPYHSKHKAPVSQTDHFNTLLDNARERVSCDSECQHRKKADELRKKYEFAKIHMNTEFKREAEKDYIVFAKGQQVYNDVLDEQLKEKALEIGTKIIDKFNEAGKKITTDINSYTVMLLNYKNVLDLYKTYKKENLALKKQIKEDSNDILTNERKTYYENQGNETLNTFYYVLIVIYIIILIVFLGCIFTMPSELKLMVKLGIFIGMILLYFVSPYILSAIIAGIYYIYSKMPKNVHLTV